MHKTTSQQFVVIYLSSATTSEVLLLNAELPDAEPVCFLPRRKDHEYSLDHYQHAFYLRSNREGKNFGLYRTVLRDEEQWTTLIPPASRRDARRIYPVYRLAGCGRASAWPDQSAAN
ncbi:hypothetical protein LNO88_17615 [Klebsiella pneumoniae subsp. pneumoniae]|nr:hypothetical protein [Klebsiella pneumoniae subsp. pneumoniae]